MATYKEEFRQKGRIREDGLDMKKKALIVFSGNLRPGSLANALRARDYEVTTFDVAVGGVDQDLRNPVVATDILSRAAAGEFSLVWIATPCKSFSVLWLGNNKPKLRTRRYPHEWRQAPLRWQAYLRKHNDLASLSAELALTAYRAGGTFVIENPADRGDRECKLFEERFADHAPLWVMPAIRHLAGQSSPTWATVPMCAFRSEFQKWTTLMAAGPAATNLRVLSYLPCLHPTHTATADGEDEAGTPLSVRAGEYPTLFSATVAALLDGCQPSSEELREALGGPAAQLLHNVMQTQRSANDKAAQEFLAELGRRREPHPIIGGEGSGVNQRGYGSGVANRWRAAQELIPVDWPEASLLPTLFAAEKESTLRYVSRRRADPEAAETLAGKPLPQPAPPPRTYPPKSRDRVPMPEGAPQEPIRIQQLFHAGVYQQILDAVEEARRPMATAAAEMIQDPTSHQDGEVSFPAGKTRVFKQAACQPEWARACVWDTTNPANCVPMQPFGIEEELEEAQSANPAFFREWGKRLKWPDEEMISQASESGSDGHSQAEWDTVVHSHHGGLRRYFRRACEMVESDTARGWIDRGRAHLATVPARLTPKNVVRQTKWKLSEDGQLYNKVKWRLTSDDSIVAMGSDSRNSTTGEEALLDPNLPSILDLAEAVAIVKAQSAAMGLGLKDREFERVALWAIDLSDAYRMLAVARHELWLQGFVWEDGIRLDRRALFGSAHLVQLFQRISSFVLAVAKVKIDEYDAQHPYTGAREAWLDGREATGQERSCSTAFIYIDDTFGLTCLNQGEPMRGAAEGATFTTSTLHVEPGGRVALRVLTNHSRPEAHLAIIKHTFSQAGWGVGIDKIQLDWQLDLLGFALSGEGQGRIFVPEAKRQGMLVDIASHVRPTSADGSVSREEVDTLVGRVSHLAAVAAEGNSYLQPMFAMARAKRRVTTKQALPGGGTRRVKRRVQPRRLHVKGATGKQVAYQECLGWWQAAFESGFSVPLAPRRTFPEPGEPGCAFLFSDAARETGTGYGGFSFVVKCDEEGRGRKPTMLYMAELWDQHTRHDLQTNRLSMPAGETIGVIVLIDALARQLEGLTHLVAFTDSSSAAAALNTANSPSPQIDYLVRWLADHHPGLQLMAIHIPGVSNKMSDDLSRDKWRKTVASVAASGITTRRMRPADECNQLIEHASTLPQRFAPYQI